VRQDSWGRRASTAAAPPAAWARASHI
jgi:hypothetical protein